jgi:Hom_end-associated Hint
MPILRAPEVARVPYMLPPLPERSWTEQPGTDGEWLCVDVLGASEHARTVTDENTASSLKVDRAAAAPPPPSGSIVRLRDYQIEAVEAVFRSWESGKKAPIIVAATGCHARGQGILMFDGSIRSAENVVEGDLLMGPDSTPRRVTSLIRGRGNMVRVVPVKGDQ